MPDWFETMEDEFWLHPDEVGGAEARFIQRALRLRRADAVLDAPCGAGRVSFHLARSGCDVTGIDLRHTFIRRARRRFRRAGLRGIFQVLDLRQLDMEARFDGVFNWAGSFGYFSEAQNARLLAAYVRALRPGGRLLIEQPDREHLLRHFQRVMQMGSVTFRGWWNARSQRLTTRRFESGVEDRRNSSSMRLYTPAQMRSLFKRQGLIVEQVHGSLVFDAYGKSVPRMIVVGRKPDAGVKAVQQTRAGRFAQRSSTRARQLAPVTDVCVCLKPTNAASRNC